VREHTGERVEKYMSTLRDRKQNSPLTFVVGNRVLGDPLFNTKMVGVGCHMIIEVGGTLSLTEPVSDIQ